MEFGCKVAGSKLLVVLGHSACGAIKGACAGAELGHLTGLLAKIQPAVDAERGAGEDGLVERVASRNVELVLDAIRDRSPVLSEMIAAGEVGLVGGMYSVETGAVAFSKLHVGP
jgi:carbonic anhydrase